MEHVLMRQNYEYLTPPLSLHSPFLHILSSSHTSPLLPSHTLIYSLHHSLHASHLSVRKQSIQFCFKLLFLITILYNYDIINKLIFRVWHIWMLFWMWSVFSFLKLYQCKWKEMWSICSILKSGTESRFISPNLNFY
jgi:hypothetical protein